MAEPAQPAETYREKRDRLARERLRVLVGDEVTPPSAIEEEAEGLPGSALYEAARKAATGQPPPPAASAPPSPGAALPPPEVPESFAGAYVRPQGEGAEIRLREPAKAPPMLIERAYRVIDPVTISPSEALDFFTLNPDEVWGAPKTDAEKAVRLQSRDAELRRQLAALPRPERDQILAGPPDKQRVARELAARQIAAVTGEDPTKAFSVITHRGATGWDLQKDYRKLVEAHEQRMLRDEWDTLTDEKRRQIREDATRAADATTAKIVMLDTGHYMVVQDPEAWKAKLRAIPHAAGFGTLLRTGAALLTTPTSRVYDGTESRASTTKWSPLDVFGKAVVSTPVGAAILRTPADEFSSSVVRSIPQVAAGPFGGLVSGWGEKPTFYDLLIDPATSDLIVEGVDMPAAAQHVGRILQEDPILSAYTRHLLPPGVEPKDASPTLLGIAATLPILFLEPDAISALFVPAGLASSALKAGTRSGLDKVEILRAVATKGEDLAALPAGERKASDLAALAYESPESYLLANDEALTSLAMDGTWKKRTQQVEQAAEEAAGRRASVMQDVRAAEEAAAQAGDTVRSERFAGVDAQVAHEAALFEAWRLEEGLRLTEAWEAHLDTIAKQGVAVAGARKVPTTPTKAALLRFAQVEAEIQGHAAMVKNLEPLQRQIASATKAGDMVEAERLTAELAERLRSFLGGQRAEREAVTAPLGRLLSEYEQLRPLFLLARARKASKDGQAALGAAKKAAAAARKAAEGLPNSGRALRAAEKALRDAKAKVSAVDAAVALPDAYYAALRAAFRKQRLSWEALSRLPRVRRGAAQGLQQAADVEKASPLVFEPSRYGTSKVRLREDVWEHVLDSAKGTTAKDGTYTVAPGALLDAARRAYGEGTIEAWIRTAGTPEANAMAERVFFGNREALHGEAPGQPVGWRDAPVTFSPEQYAVLQRGWDQLHRFAESHLTAQPVATGLGKIGGEAADVGRARAILFQAEADPLLNKTLGGNAILRGLRKVALTMGRRFDPDQTKFGAHMRGDFPQIVKSAAARYAHGHAEVRELTMRGEPAEIMARVWRYLDTTDAVEHARGSTFGNRMTGRTYWQDFQDYARSVRTARKAGRKAARAGSKDAADVFEDARDPAIEAAIVMWLGRGADVLQPDQRAALIAAGLRAIDRSPTAEVFADTMAKITASKGFGGVLDPRLGEVQGRLTSAVMHGATMKEAQKQIVQSTGGFVSVQDAMAFNALLLHGTTRVGADIDKAVAMVTRMGVPFARADKALFQDGVKVADLSRRLVAMGMDEASGQSYFVPRQLIDELNKTVNQMVKKFEPYAETEDVPWLLSMALGAQHGWRMSAIGGFVVPKPAYPFVNIMFGDLPVVMIHEGPVMAAKVLAQTLPAYLPAYGRVFQKWHDRTGAALPPAFSAFVSPRMGMIFGGRDGTVTLGKRAMPAREARAMLVDDEILSTQLGEEAHRSLEGIVQDSWMKSTYRKWQHEIVAHNDLIAQRTRAALYFQLLDEGVPRAEAARRTKGALLDWTHGFTQWEQGMLLRLNMPFYRWWRLSLAQALGVITDPVTRSADPAYWAQIATGRTRISRTRQQAQIQSAIPDWAAAYQVENSNGDLDEYDALTLSMTGSADWTRGRWSIPIVAGEGSQKYHEEYGRKAPIMMAVGPEAAGVVTFGWWLNFLAMGAAVSAGILFPSELESRHGAGWKLMEDNLASMLGPFAITAFSEAEKFRGRSRVRVSPGEIGLLAQLDAAMPLWESDTRQNPETGKWEADAGNVFLIRSVPIILQIPNTIASVNNPYGNDGFGKAFAAFLLRQLGVTKLYSRDPAADQERELRHQSEMMEQAISDAVSRSGRRPD